jgi:hypothetical protein
MTRSVMLMLLASIFSCFSLSSPAQTGKKTNDETAYRTDNIRQQVAKIGTGPKARVEVKLSNRSSYVGYISEANATSFVVVDKAAKSNSINYADVASLYHSGGKTGLWIAVAAGAGLAVALLIWQGLQATPPK